MKTTKIIFISLVGWALCGFTTEQSSAPMQPPAERRAQDKLPKSHDPMWNILGKTQIHLNEKQGLYSATFPAQVKALVGKEVTISGFMLPLEATEKFHHFILSKRTPTCPFCPPGEPNEIVDVWVDKAVGWNEDVVKVTGAFGLMDNPQLGLFFKITKAKML